VKEVFSVKEVDVIERIPEALARALQNVPLARIDDVSRDATTDDGARADLVIRVRALGLQRTLVFDVKASGQPKPARDSITQLARIARGSVWGEVYPVFAAPYVSEAAATLLRNSGIGYLDLAGNCRLAFPDAYLEKTCASAPREPRGAPSLFSPKASRILRVLLNEPQREWQVQQLAKVAEVSIGLASRIKTELEEREWVSIAANGVRLAQPEAALRAWSDAYDYRQNRLFEYYSPDAPGDSEAAIAEWCRENGVEYALTGFSGARLSSPRVRYNRATIYVRSRIDSVATNTRLKPVDSGGNVILLKPFDDGVFAGAETRYGLRTVSPAQLYADLRSIAGRGDEAAEEILERELRPSWQ
jgi:hypothetical protein